MLALTINQSRSRSAYFATPIAVLSKCEGEGIVVFLSLSALVCRISGAGLSNPICGTYTSERALAACMARPMGCSPEATQSGLNLLSMPTTGKLLLSLGARLLQCVVSLASQRVLARPIRDSFLFVSYAYPTDECMVKPATARLLVVQQARAARSASNMFSMKTFYSQLRATSESESSTIHGRSTAVHESNGLNA